MCIEYTICLTCFEAEPRSRSHRQFKTAVIFLSDWGGDTESLALSNCWLNSYVVKLLSSLWKNTVVVFLSICHQSRPLRVDCFLLGRVNFRVIKPQSQPPQDDRQIWYCLNSIYSKVLSLSFWPFLPNHLPTSLVHDGWIAVKCARYIVLGWRSNRRQNNNCS